MWWSLKKRSNREGSFKAHLHDLATNFSVLNPLSALVPGSSLFSRKRTAQDGSESNSDDEQVQGNKQKRIRDAKRHCNQLLKGKRKRLQLFNTDESLCKIWLDNSLSHRLINPRTKKNEKTQKRQLFGLFHH